MKKYSKTKYRRLKAQPVTFLAGDSYHAVRLISAQVSTLVNIPIEDVPWVEMAYGFDQELEWIRLQVNHPKVIGLDLVGVLYPYHKGNVGDTPYLGKIGYLIDTEGAVDINGTVPNPKQRDKEINDGLRAIEKITFDRDGDDVIFSVPETEESRL
jgi:hypothetical protein